MLKLLEGFEEGLGLFHSCPWWLQLLLYRYHFQLQKYDSSPKPTVRINKKHGISVWLCPSLPKLWTSKLIDLSDVKKKPTLTWQNRFSSHGSRWKITSFPWHLSCDKPSFFFFVKIETERPTSSNYLKHRSRIWILGESREMGCNQIQPK